MDYFAAVVFVLWVASVVYTFVGMRRTAKLHFLALLQLKDSSTTCSTIASVSFIVTTCQLMILFTYEISVYFTIFGKVIFRFLQVGALRSEAKAA